MKMKRPARKRRLVLAILPVSAICVLLAAFGSTAFGSGSESPPYTGEYPYLTYAHPAVGESIEASEVGWISSVDWVGLPEGKTSVNGTGGPFSVSVSSAGIHFVIACESRITGAVLENLSGGRNGQGTAKLSLVNCSTDTQNKTPNICKVTPGPARTIYFGPGTGRDERGFVELSVIPEGGLLASLTLSECEGFSAFNGSWEVTGDLLGKYPEYSSRAQFNADPAAPPLKARGITATATWSLRLSSSSGAGIEAGPFATSYSWKRCTGASCETIPGASSSVYVPTSRDVGKSLAAVITATNGGGSTSVESERSATIE